MPKYRVLDQRGIEHGSEPGNQRIYFPFGTQYVPRLMASGGHGGDIPTDVSGFIDLEPEQAAQLQDWQIPHFEGKPIAAEHEGKATERATLARVAEEERLDKEKKEYEEFQAFKKAKGVKAAK